MKVCNVCCADIDLEAGDIIGYFGILEVSFCVWCMSAMTDMVIQQNDLDNINTLKERIKELEDEGEA